MGLVSMVKDCSSSPTHNDGKLGNAGDEQQSFALRHDSAGNRSTEAVTTGPSAFGSGSAGLGVCDQAPGARPAVRIARTQCGFMLLVVLVLCTSLSSPALSQTVKGHVEDFNVSPRLSRPKGLGLAGPMKTAPSINKKGLSLSTGTTGNILCLDHFKLGTNDCSVDGQHPQAARPLRVPGNVDSDEHSKELTVAWDEWHRRVISAFYQRWKDGIDTTGQSRVTIIVTCNGKVEFTLSDFEQPDFANYDPGAEAAFKHAIDDCIMHFEKTPVLEFPPMSQRKEVKLVTTFSMNMFGPSGYSYKHGDFEHVHTPAGK